MVGRDNWRKSAAFVLALGACAALIFASAAPLTNAQSGFMDRMRLGVQDRIRQLSDSAEEVIAEGNIRVTAKSARALSLEQDKLERDKSLITWGGASFDPKREQPVPKGALPE